MKILSSIYVVCSIFIGPSIVFYALGRGKAGMDCSEATWYAIPQSVKAAYYHEAALIMGISSAVMLALGTFLVYRLLKSKRDVGTTILTCLVGVVMAGYLLILIEANNWNC